MSPDEAWNRFVGSQTPADNLGEAWRIAAQELETARDELAKLRLELLEINVPEDDPSLELAVAHVDELEQSVNMALGEARPFAGLPGW